MSLFDRILESRGLVDNLRLRFLQPEYETAYDPFLLPDMQKAVDRLVIAKERQERICIYGDYDIDGITATVLVYESLKVFGFKKLDIYLPNRFVEGYGLTMNAVEDIAKKDTNLIVTVDCGSLSRTEIMRAANLGMDVIVTDHHNVAESQPPAIAVVNPKRHDHKYPFRDLAGVGVAFKLVQALQISMEGMVKGQEKWLLDLVALGTVCDVVPLIDENRAYVYWGMKVLSKTRRVGLRSLSEVSGVDLKNINSRHIGFKLGPRMNASGRLETAQYAFDLLVSKNIEDAIKKAELLDDLNTSRKDKQNEILKSATEQAERYISDPVLVLSHADWSHGIVGIVASKLMEKYKKPVFVLQELGEKSKGSARSYGDFSAAEAIRAAEDILIKGGGHNVAAGLTIATDNIPAFRDRVNRFYIDCNIKDQQYLLLPKEDVTVDDFSYINEELVSLIDQMEPFGCGNLEPVFRSDNLKVQSTKRMGAESQYLKIVLSDSHGNMFRFSSFNVSVEHFNIEPGDYLSIWYNVFINEWLNKRSIEGRILHLCKNK